MLGDACLRRSFLSDGHCKADAKGAERRAARARRRARSGEATSYPMERKRDQGCAPGPARGRSGEVADPGGEPANGLKSQSSEISIQSISHFVGQLTGRGARGLKKCPEEVGTRRPGAIGARGGGCASRPDPFRARPRTGATRPDPFRARPRTGAARPNPFRARPKGGGAAAEANPGETSRSIPVDLPVGGSAIEAGRLAPRDSARRDASGRGVRRSSRRRLRGRQAAWLADMGGGRAGRLDRGRSGQRDERKAARPRAFGGF